jgi:hypothetical protein
VSSAWLIVPSPGRAAISSGSCRSAAEVAHRVVLAERDEQPAHSLHDQRAARRRLARGREHARGLDPLSGELGGEVRRGRGPVAQGGDLRGAHPRGAREQLVVRRPPVRLLLEAGDDGLVRPHGLAFGGDRGEQRGAQRRLAGPRIGARDEEPAHAWRRPAAGGR